jgi:hypothetical protein
MEQLVFDRMNQMARDELSKHGSLDVFEPGPLQNRGTYYRQTFKARGELGEGHGKGQVRVLAEDRPDRPHNHSRNLGLQVLTVPVGTHQMVACSLSCGETDRPDQKVFSCDGSILSFEPLGDLASEPSISTVGKFIAGVRRQPLSGVGIFAGLLMVVAGIVLAARGLMRASSAKA